MKLQKGNKHILRTFIIAIILVVIISIGIGITILVTSIKKPKSMSIANNWDIIVDAQKPEYAGYVKRYYEKVTFVIEEQVDNDDGTGMAKVTVTTPNMGIILEKVLNDLYAEDSLSDEDLAEQAQESMEELLMEDCETITTSIEVSTKYVDGKWKIIPNEEWNKAITSNMAEIYREYYEKIITEDMK